MNDALFFIAFLSSLLLSSFSRSSHIPYSPSLLFLVSLFLLYALHTPTPLPPPIPSHASQSHLPGKVTRKSCLTVLLKYWSWYACITLTSCSFSFYFVPSIYLFFFPCSAFLSHFFSCSFIFLYFPHYHFIFLLISRKFFSCA